VPPPLRLWPGNPSSQRTAENSSTSWTRECSSVCFHIFSFLFSTLIDDFVSFSFSQGRGEPEEICC
jgi:hypothetical protein